MNTETAQRRGPFDEQDSPEQPRVSSTVERIRKQVSALRDRTDRLHSLLGPVLLPSDEARGEDPRPARSAPPLVASLDDILDELVGLVMDIDSLGDRVAL